MNYFIVFILAFIIWQLLTWSVEPANFLAGAIASLFTSFLFGREFPYHPKNTFQIKRYLIFLKFLLIFLRQMIKANLIMAYRVLSPGPPIKPGIVKIPLRIKSPLGRVIFANAITLAPGTFTMDIESDFLIIHWIYMLTEDPVQAEKMICGNLQEVLKEVFE